VIDIIIGLFIQLIHKKIDDNFFKFNYNFVLTCKENSNHGVKYH
jgi:hypothetical protein